MRAFAIYSDLILRVVEGSVAGQLRRCTTLGRRVDDTLSCSRHAMNKWLPKQALRTPPSCQSIKTPGNFQAARLRARMARFYLIYCANPTSHREVEDAECIKYEEVKISYYEPSSEVV